MSHQDYQDSAAAYALGALRGDELAAFEAHVDACEECRVEVESHRQTTELLALAAPTVTPADGAALRTRILREATQVRPIRGAREMREMREARAADVSPRSVARVHERPAPLAQPTPGSGWAARAPWLAAAACLVLAIGSFAAWQRERTRLDSLSGDLVAARAEIASRDSTIASFLGPQVHVVSLAEPEQKPRMRVFWNHTRNVFIVTAFNVPRAPDGKTYQLWAIRNGKAPLSMGTFNTDAAGRAVAVVPVPQGVTDGGFIDDCALTMEPSGGSSQPSETPRLVGPWRHVD